MSLQEKLKLPAFGSTGLSSSPNGVARAAKGRTRKGRSRRMVCSFSKLMVVSLMICMLLEGIHRAYLYYPQCIVVGVDIVSDKRLEYIFS